MIRFARLVPLLLLLCSSVAGAATWEGGGPEGGWIRELFAPTGPTGPIYAGTYGGGLWITLDDGQSWSPATDGFGDAVVVDMDAAADALGTLYAASEDQGVLRGRFASLVWSRVNTGINDPDLPIVTAVAAHPDPATMVTVSTSRGIFTSRDRGNSWPDSLSWRADLPMFDVAVSPLAPQSIFALSQTEIFFTADRGRTIDVLASRPTARLRDMDLWPGSLDSLVAVGTMGGLYQLRGEKGLVEIGPSGLPVFHCVEVEGSPPVILAGSDQGLHLSDDLGASWSLDDGQLGDYPEVWAVTPADVGIGDLWVGTFGHGVMRRPAGGGAWAPHNDGLKASWSTGLHQQAGRWLSGSVHGRVHVSDDDGLSWVDVTGDLDVLQITGVRMLRGGSPWLVGTLAGLWRSVDEGAQWDVVDLPAGHAKVRRLLQPDWMDADEVWATTDTGVLRSVDAGQSWTEVDGLQGLGTELGSKLGVVAAAASTDSVLVFAPDEDDLYWGPPEGPFSSLSVPAGFGTDFAGLDFVAGVSSRLIVSSSSPSGSALYRIEDPTGPSPEWVDLEPTLPVGSPVGGDVVTETGTGRVVVALEGGGIVESLDGGDSWTLLNADLPVLFFERLHLVEGEPPRLAVSTVARGVWVRDLQVAVPTLVRRFAVEAEGEGVRVVAELSGRGAVELWRSVDGGTSGPVRSLREGERLDFLDVDPVLAKAEEVVYQLRRSGRGEILDETRLALAPAAGFVTHLRGAHPNPFNPRTTVVFETPGGWVSLRVVDLRGRQVRSLLERRVEAGVHRVIFDGRDDRGRELASGSYLVRVEGAGRHDSLPLTLVR